MKNILSINLFEIASPKIPKTYHYDKPQKFNSLVVIDCYFEASDKNSTKYVISYNYYPSFRMVYISFTLGSTFIRLTDLIGMSDEENEQYKLDYIENSDLNLPFSVLSNVLFLISDFIDIYQPKYNFDYIGMNADENSNDPKQIQKSQIYKYYITSLKTDINITLLTYHQ